MSYKNIKGRLCFGWLGASLKIRAWQPYYSLEVHEPCLLCKKKVEES